MSPGNIPAFQLLLDILLEFQRPDLVKQCLGMASRLSLPQILKGNNDDCPDNSADL